MYHLFVTAERDAWKQNTFYKFPISRFLEYTDDDVAEHFKVLTETHIQTLCSFPCLFAYEGEDEDVYVGRLLSIEERSGPRSLLIEFEIDRNVAPIAFERLKPIRDALDIRGWEMSRTHWALKNVDLFKRLSNVGLITGASAAQAIPIEPVGNLPPSANAELAIASLQDFVRIVLEYQAGNDEVFYRGHSNQVYKLEPSLFRRDKQGNYLYRDVEEVLYRELLVSNSIDFNSDNYTLDRLVRMQHFSLPTRLLDITSNPLIALYFACKSRSSANDGAEIPGEVILLTVAREQIKYFDSDTASCIANLARLSSHDREHINFDIEEIDEFNNQMPLRRLLHFVKEEKAFFEPKIRREDLRSIICVKGKRSNNRISSQSGAFLLFGYDTVLDEKGTEKIGVKRITVTNKNDILKQLDRMNINESTVFPYIENSARYVAEKFRFRSH